uniref:Uncharacterized protein n=1 Tax=Romanomermis culicivorax TaxID=13658 RepID=A0A915JTY3_ROMCU
MFGLVLRLIELIETNDVGSIKAGYDLRDFFAFGETSDFLQLIRDEDSGISLSDSELSFIFRELIIDDVDGNDDGGGCC